MSKTIQWRRTLGQKMRSVTPEQAKSILEQHRVHGAHIGDPNYRALTGGFSSQAIDTVVTRKLAEKVIKR